jgi:hypothetical protein
VFKSYLDGSGVQKPPAKANSLTLAGHVAKDEVWAEFEQGWLEILKSHEPSPKYMHMKEAMSLRGEYDCAKGWTSTLVNALIERILRFAIDTRWDDRIYAVCCTINLDDHQRGLNEGYKLKPPHDFCAAICCEKIIALQLLNADRYPQGQVVPIESIDFFFDHNELFRDRFEKLWREHGGRTSREPTWDQVNQVSAIDMRKNPPLQFADMLAWSRNRAIAVGGHADLCAAILHITDSSGYDLDYDSLTKPHRRIV